MRVFGISFGKNCPLSLFVLSEQFEPICYLWFDSYLKFSAADERILNAMKNNCFFTLCLLTAMPKRE